MEWTREDWTLVWTAIGALATALAAGLVAHDRLRPRPPLIFVSLRGDVFQVRTQEPVLGTVKALILPRDLEGCAVEYEYSAGGDRRAKDAPFTRVIPLGMRLDKAHSEPARRSIRVRRRRTVSASKTVFWAHAEIVLTSPLIRTIRIKTQISVPS